MGFSKVMGDIMLSTKRHSPEIKFIFGVITFGAALYTTHKAALKCELIKEKKKELMRTIEEAKEDAENGNLPDVEGLDTYTEQDYKTDRRKANLIYGLDVAKNYALPAAFSIASIWLFRGAVLDYKNMFVGVGAAYNALLMKYNDKMKFIKEELGDEKFQELEEGFKTKQVVNAQSTGLKSKAAKKEERDKCNPYSRFFDELHHAWTPDPEVNKFFLLGKQNELDAQLQRVGHLFLNDAYVFCGYEETDAGRVMGWVRDNPDGTINHVDFGIFNIHDEASRWFVNGLEPIFLIDFNVDPEPITGRIGWAKY